MKPLRPYATVIALAAAGVLAYAGSTLMRVDPNAGPCVMQRGPVRLPDLPEASGLAVSRRHPGILWSHNDSGNAAVLFALDATGSVRARIKLPISTRDWEDISAGRCANTNCLYVADIGDNQRVRSDVRIHRLPEPDLTDGIAASLETFIVKYPDGAHNAEGMFVVGDDIFIVTRDQIGIVYRATVPSDRRDMTMTRVGTLGLRGVSDADTSTDGESVVVRTSREAVLYRAADIAAGKLTPYQRIPLDGLREPQGEAVALDGETLFLASEGGALYNAGTFLPLKCVLER